MIKALHGILTVPRCEILNAMMIAFVISTLRHSVHAFTSAFVDPRRAKCLELGGEKLALWPEH